MHLAGGEPEWKTRRDRVDQMLKSCGWTIAPADKPPRRLTAHALTEYPTANGPADYALFVDGKLRISCSSSGRSRPAAFKPDFLR